MMGWEWILQKDNCTGCSICCDVCPEDAIALTLEMAYPAPKAGECTGCLTCVDECPFDAIEVNESI